MMSQILFLLAKQRCWYYAIYAGILSRVNFAAQKSLMFGSDVALPINATKHNLSSNTALASINSQHHDRSGTRKTGYKRTGSGALQ
jgi:hypothetical protein